MLSLKFTTSGMPSKVMANPFTVDNAKGLLPMGKPSINIGNPFWLMSLEIQSLALDVSTLWLLNEE